MRKWRVDFKNKSTNDGFYDLVDDWDLVSASLDMQYHMRCRTDIKEMKWGELSSRISRNYA